MKISKWKKFILIVSITLLISALILLILFDFNQKTYTGIKLVYDTNAEFISADKNYVLIKDDNYKLLDNNLKEKFIIDSKKKIYYFNLYDDYIVFYQFNEDDSNSSMVYDLKGNMIKEINGYVSLIIDEITNSKYFTVSDYTAITLYDENFNKIYDSKSFFEIKVLNNIIYPYSYDGEDIYEMSSTNNQFTAYDLNNKKLFKFSNFIQLEDYIIISGEKNFLYNAKTKELKEYMSYEYKNEKNILKNEKEIFIIDYLGHTYKENEMNIIKYEKGYNAVSCDGEGYILKDKNNKIVFSQCASFYDLNHIEKNIILAYFTNKNNEDDYKVAVKVNDKKIETNDYIEVIGNYIIVNENQEKTFYDLKLNKVEVDYNCKNIIEQINENEYYCSNFKKYIMGDDLKTVKGEYNDIFCFDEMCVLTNEKGQEAIYSDGKILTNFKDVYDIRHESDIFFIKTLYGNKIIKIGETNNKEDLKKIIITPKYDDVDIDNIIKTYKLEDIKNIINNNKELFKKYASIVSKNESINGFESKVYNMFKYIAINKDNIDIDYLLYALKDLKIKKVDKLGTNQAGLYYDYDKRIEILDNEDRVIYHELMHFIDYNAKYKDDEFVKCDNKYYKYSEIKDKNLKCDYSDINAKVNFITEGGAEYYMSIFYNDGEPVVYKTPVSIYSALRYIYGEDEINNIFIDTNEAAGLYNLIVKKTGLSGEEYKKFINIFNKSTEIVNYDYDINEEIVDALIKIYEAEKKKKYTEDFNFLTILYCIISEGYNTKYKSIMSNHEKELLKVVSNATTKQYYIYPFVMINDDREYYITFNGFDENDNYGKYKVYFNLEGMVINIKFNKI